jgi:hypothetical protein
MAEAESFKGKTPASSSSVREYSISTGNGGGHNKAGVKENWDSNAQGV